MSRRVMTGAVAAGGLVLAAALAAGAQPARAATPDDCASLADLPVKDGVVTAATLVLPPTPAEGKSPLPNPEPAPGQPAYPPLPPGQFRFVHCRVQITVKPEAGSNIRIEVWLPARANWNGKFLGTGNTGTGGTILTQALMDGLNRGYAVANTDLGSSSGKGGPGYAFGVGRPELQKDFLYRATDAMTLEGKALTAFYYGAKPKFSYFQGCGVGGAQAFEQIAHLPDAYNGVIAGAPMNQRPALDTVRLWNTWNNLASPDATLTRRKLELVATAAIEQCDDLDGAKDGILTDPRDCLVSLKPLMCGPAGDGPDCLTERQVATVRAIWRGPTNPRTLTSIYRGVEAGAEGVVDLDWDARPGPGGEIVVQDSLVNWSAQYQKAHPDGVGFDFDRDFARAGEDLIDAYWADSSLYAFKKAGGKLIVYQGWADGVVPPAGTVAFFEEILKSNGETTGDFAKLYMAPGMGHCGGGVGPDQFELLVPLEEWAEKQAGPLSIVSIRRPHDGLPQMIRPICPYPGTSAYLGDGDVNDASNWICGRQGGAEDYSEH